MSTSKIYTMGSMLTTEILSVTSFATNFPIENAFDLELDSYWKPTNTNDQTITLDLHKETELIDGIENMDFSSASDWVNVDLNTYGETGNLAIVSSADGQSCELVAAGLKDGFLPGRTYRITYDYAELAAGFTFHTRNSSTNADSVGTPVAGTGQTMEFTATKYADKFAIAGLNGATGDFDNFSITIMDDRQLVDSYAIWVKNIEADLAPSSTPRIYLEYSDDNTNWTELYNNTHEAHVQSYSFGNMYLLKGSTPLKGHRYWRFRFTSNATVIQVAGLYLLREWDITAAPDEFPQRNPSTFFSKGKTDKMGNRAVNVGRTQPTITHIRRWKIPTQAVYDDLQSMWEQSLGGGLPVILLEGTEAWVCDILEQSFDPKKIDDGFWEITLSFREKPWTLPAETF